MSEKIRNTYVDVVRGLAMLMVVLGHTMTTSVSKSENSVLLNIIWTLQMPLFILISGYVTRYSKEIKTIQSYFGFIRKRTFSYLVPWISWTILIKAFLYQNYKFLNPRFILWNMDSGYWFLFTIWTIALIYGTAEYLSSKVVTNSNVLKKEIYKCIIYVIGMIVLLSIGLRCGISFLGIKLTLYYMPFYYLGYLWGKITKEKTLNHTKIYDGIIAISLLIWVFLLRDFNIYKIGESVIGILIRATASITGCIAAVGLGINLDKSLQDRESNVRKLLEWVGKSSLEIYLLHGTVLSLLKFNLLPVFWSVEGIILVFANFVITIVMCVVIISLLKGNKVINKILFGK